MTGSELQTLCEALEDQNAPAARRQAAAWILGHHDDAAAVPVLFAVADDESASEDLRRVASYAWWRLGRAGDAAPAARALSSWPAPVLAPTFRVLLDETTRDAQRDWARQAASGDGRQAEDATLLLGDYAAEPVAWAFMSPDEWEVLSLGREPADWLSAYAAGREWAVHPPATFFGQRAFQDAYRWAVAALQMRVAKARYAAVRRWERWLLEQVGDLDSDALAEEPTYRVIPLPEPRPAAEATTLVILGAYREGGRAEDHQGISTAFSAAAAGLHVTLSQVYEDAQKTAWHMAGLTGRLELELLHGSG